MTCRTGIAVLLMLAGSHLLHAAAQSPAALKIVVLEGEDGVNVVRQRTAVAPVVEVRDRNDQPVAGAIVRFAIRSGHASFSGGRTLAVTTNAAGRATAEGLTPTGTGGLQITATASFQGQAATAVIAQVNVATAAQAGAAAAAGSAAGTSGGAATGAGAGSGISATTIGIVGAAAAGGTIVGVKALKGSGSSGTAYAGPFSLQVAQLITSPTGSNPCTNTGIYEGTLTVTFPQTTGAVTGTADINVPKQGAAATTCFAGFAGSFNSGSYDGIALTGTTDNLSFTRSFDAGGTSIDGSGTVVSSTTTWSFGGVRQSDGSITGALTVTEHSSAGTGATARVGNGTASVNVVLH